MTRNPRQARILVLPRYERNGASSRLRTYQYEPYLKEAGFAVEYAPFFDEAYLRALYAGNHAIARTLPGYTRRVSRLWTGSRPDLIWMEKEAFPWWPLALERALLPRAVPIVSDYDDAIHVRYAEHPRPLVRRALGGKIDGIMSRSAMVLAGNAFLAARAAASGAERVETVPTVIDTTRYRPRGPAANARGKIVVGWIGSPSTWETQARPLVPLLTRFVEAGLITVRAVGTHSREQRPGFEFWPWSEATEIELIRGMDVGIMPLPDTSWAQGKCGYKLIQYMGCGLPVIASPVGANRTIVRHGENGFLAETENDWREAIATLVADASLRASLGRNGRRTAEECFSLQAWGPQVARLLKDLIGRPGP